MTRVADEVPLGSVTTWLSGGTPNRSNDAYWSGSIPWISATSLKGARIYDSDQHVTAEAVRAGSKKDTRQYQQYFCAVEAGNAEQIKSNEPRRVELYKAVAAVIRAYGNLANEMDVAGYSDTEAAAIKAEIAHYADVREEVKLGAGENVDFKQHEADMRHLLDTYINAAPSEVVSDFKDTGLIQLIARMGASAIDKLPKGIKKDPESVAETITNNMRKVIIDEHAMNPKYYDKMSQLLDAILDQRRQGALNYKNYLAKLLEHAAKLGNNESDTAYPEWADNGALRALVDFFFPKTQLAIDRHDNPTHQT